jgi:CGNR zinc finger protein
MRRERQRTEHPAMEVQADRRRLAKLLEFGQVEDYEALPARRFAAWQKWALNFPRLDRKRLVERSSPEEPNAKELNRLAAWLREVLSFWGRGQGYKVPASTLDITWWLTGSKLTMSGSFESTFKLDALQELASVGERWLRVCASPSCQKLFIGRKRALHCSRRCAAREEMRRYRARQRGQLAPVARGTG